MLGKLAITALMRRVPRPITPDNDTATKNACSITGPGHKPRFRSGADNDSERAGPGAAMKEPAGPGWCVRGGLRARARLARRASAETGRRAEGGGLAGVLPGEARFITAEVA